MRTTEFSALSLICFVNFVETFNLPKYHFFHSVIIDHLTHMSVEMLNFIENFYVLEWNIPHVRLPILIFSMAITGFFSVSLGSASGIMGLSENICFH